MKHCLCCGHVAEAAEPTCQRCGEGSWSAVVEAEPRPKASKKGAEPKPKASK